MQVVALALLTGGLVAGVLLYLRGSAPSCDAQDLPAGAGGKRVLFQGWAKPDVALLLSGQMHGYLQPCGCSSPQLGGLARRYNFLRSLKERGWPVVSVDLGDLAQKSGPQAMLKYTTAMQALHLMDYTAVAIGKHELDMPLIDALSEYSLNNPSPRVLAANLFDKQGQLIRSMVRSWEVAGKDGTPKVGVIGLVGPSITDKVTDPSVKFAGNNGALLKEALGQLGKVDLVVLLYEGSGKEARACAEFCAQAHKAEPALPRVHVVQCLSEDEEPPSVPEQAGNSLLITVGHKGRYVGVVGAFRAANANQPWELRYQLVPVGPEYQTPPGKDAANPVEALMEDYTKELKARDYLARFPLTQHPVQIQYPNAKYVGSERCAECHEHAYAIWEKSNHSKAYKTLINASRPSLRQFDGECVVCHVVGFAHPSGYYEKGNTEKRNDLLKNIGCESCHGPASVHVNNPTDKTIYPFINPWKAKPQETADETKARLLRVNFFCQKCHDVDNDVHWSFEKKWPAVVHTTPRKAAQAK
jgi:hypothetical protein